MPVRVLLLAFPRSLLTTSSEMCVPSFHHPNQPSTLHLPPKGQHYPLFLPLILTYLFCYIGNWSASKRGIVSSNRNEPMDAFYQQELSWSPSCPQQSIQIHEYVPSSRHFPPLCCGLAEKQRSQSFQYFKSLFLTFCSLLVPISYRHHLPKEGVRHSQQYISSLGPKRRPYERFKMLEPFFTLLRYLTSTFTNIYPLIIFLVPSPLQFDHHPAESLIVRWENKTIFVLVSLFAVFLE